MITINPPTNFYKLNNFLFFHTVNSFTYLQSIFHLLKMSHLISKRASGRTTSHFTAVNANDKPEDFKPHPNTLPLHWGLPNDGFFPVESIEVNLVEYPFQKNSSLPVTNTSLESLNPSLSGSISGGQTLTPPVTSLDDSLRKVKINENKKLSKIIIPRESDDPKVIDLKQGLQYSEIEGIPQLRKFTQDFTKRVNNPAYKEWSTIITGGAGDGLNKAVDALLDEGDVILIEEFTFTPFLLNVRNSGGIPVPVKLDLNTTPDKSNGIDLEYLIDLLDNWDDLKPDMKGKKPKALYTIATGQNPTGLTQTLEFRKKVYALAEKHDFAIIEDDPYGYLSLPPFRKPDPFLKLDEFLTVDEFIEDHLTPSYLRLDTSGRVIRIETFSKLFAPGLRLGFIVANKDIIEAISNYASIVTRSSSGTSQLLVNNVIQQNFGGVDGWLNWILKLKETYTHRRNVLVNEFYESKAFKEGYLDLIDPRAGMFVSIILNFPKGTDIVKKIKLLNWKFLNYGVGVVPGINMAVDKEFSADRANFYRLTYAPANSDEEIIEAARRATSAIKDFFEKNLEY